MQLTSLSKGRFAQYWQYHETSFTEIIHCYVKDKRMLNEGDYLMTQGQEVKELLLVDSGAVALGYTAENGRRFQLGTMECHEQLFGEMEFFTLYPCQLDITAQEPLIVYSISCQQLEQALIDSPTLALFFASAIAVDYQDTLNIFFHRMLYPIMYNIAHDLYCQYQNTAPVGSLAKCYLEAERFGTTDRVYRRAVNMLVDMGLVTRNRGKIDIVDIKRMEEYLFHSPFQHA